MKRIREVEVVDCTLRDGEQTPGVWFTIQEKSDIAVALDRAGVSVLDAGFPAACGEDVEALQELRRLNLRARIAATSRPLASDVDAARRARVDEVFMFLPVSDQHLDTKLRMSRQRSASLLDRGIAAALDEGLDVSFVAEDALRADEAWLREIVDRALAHRLKRVVLCDTVGAAVPSRMSALVASLVASVPDDVALCLHCHNDFGMATANTVAGVIAGASSVSCTVNGIGERAGNADLAEVCAAVTHLVGRPMEIAPSALLGLAELVERVSGVHTSALKPVTGSNVYAHESGVHVDGMLKDKRNYEHLASSWVGASSRYVMGKHSGTRLLQKLLAEDGVELTREELDRALVLAKRHATGRSKARHEVVYGIVKDFRASALAGLTGVELRDIAERIVRGRRRRTTASDAATSHSRSTSCK